MKKFSTLIGAPFFTERLMIVRSADPYFKPEKLGDNTNFISATTFDSSLTDDNRMFSIDQGKS